MCSGSSSAGQLGALKTLGYLYSQMAMNCVAKSYLLCNPDANNMIGVPFQAPQ